MLYVDREHARREHISSGTLYRHLQQAKETSTAAAKAGLIAVEVIGSRLERDGDGGLSVVLPRGRGHPLQYVKQALQRGSVESRSHFDPRFAVSYASHASV